MGVLNKIHTHTHLPYGFFSVCFFKSMRGLILWRCISYNLLNTETIFEFETHDDFFRKHNNNQKRIIHSLHIHSVSVISRRELSFIPRINK